MWSTQMKTFMKKTRKKKSHENQLFYEKKSRYLARFNLKEDLALREAAAKVGLSRASFVRNAALAMASKLGCFSEFVDEITTGQITT